MTPIFTESFLAHYINDFRAASITDIRGITILIKSFVHELDSGKLETLKEEEIKSRFINKFFGDVLGFNYGNSNWWQLREEKKAVGDGTKADAALGYFSNTKENGDVRVVIEMKDALTDLDTKQNRRGNQTPVEQAFSYVPKMGGKCKWVIVSNIKEIRIYNSNDSSKYQCYFLKDLLDESKRNELLFLFHKDRFIKREGKSQTDLLLEKSKIVSAKEDLAIHIIDKIYNCINRFDGLGFIDPEYIATLYPFNILNDHVWHYDGRTLFTINYEIYELLKEVSIENKEVVFTEKLKIEIEEVNVINAKAKLETVFEFLNHCLINNITAIKDYKKIEERNRNTIGFHHRSFFGFKEGEEGITKNIHIIINNACDCMSCCYRSLDFNKFLRRLKAAHGDGSLNTLEYAFGNYLAASDNFKSTYSIYKAIEKESKGAERKEIVYFLSKYNTKYLHNLISDYQYDDSNEILNDVKSVDLDKVIYDEIEFNLDKEVRTYLIDIKEDVLIYKLQDRIEEITFELDKLKRFYENGGVQSSGRNLIHRLFDAYYLLYLHINRNYIVYDTFKRYKQLTEKVFKGLVTSYLTKENRLEKFNSFFLTEAIIHITPNALQEILKEVDEITADSECIDEIVLKLNNLISSYFKDGLFNEPYENSLFKEYLNNLNFKNKFTDIFSNIFTILSRLKISKNQFSNTKKPLLKFLKLESELYWFNIKQFERFILIKGDLFEANELVEILKISVERDRYGYNKYTGLIKNSSKSIFKFYPDNKIEPIKLIQTAILNCTSDEGNHFNFIHLIPLLKICRGEAKQILIDSFEKELSKKFDTNLYEQLLEKGDYDYNLKDYFTTYSKQINVSKGGRAYKFGEQKFTDLIFIHYVYLIYKLNIDFDRSELQLLVNLNEFESWLINPIKFDYSKFNVNWLLDLNDPIFLNRLKDIEEISFAIESNLKSSFEPLLAEIRYKYFTKRSA